MRGGISGVRTGGAAGGAAAGVRGRGPSGAGLTPARGLLAATALHLGFQAVVTLVTYPALAEVPAGRWRTAHAAHTRRITVLVVPVYALLGVACLRALPVASRTASLAVGVTASGVAVLSTALVAGPTHRRLGREGRTDALLSRLRRSDGVRLAAAAVAAGGALVAVHRERGPAGA